MPDLKYYDIIIKPIITEKAMKLSAEKKYCFYVHPKANKCQIKEAVEKLFDGVKVKKVFTMNLKGKLKRRGRIIGYTSKTKKAIVLLKDDSKEIVLFAAV